jgi:hypothetical protein
MPVQIDDRTPLGRQGNAGDARRFDALAGKKSLACPAQGVPENIGILFGPTGVL